MSRRLPAEWEPQDAIQLTLPHPDTDWIGILTEAQACFKQIAHQISKRQHLLLVCQNIEEAKGWLGDLDTKQVSFHQVPSNDSWARDHAAITVYDDETPVLFDFVFNGWGMKFAADQDNQITRRLHRQMVFGYTPLVTTGFVLEGGSIESDGQGTLLTTSNCLLSYNRNPSFGKEEITRQLQSFFGTERILWLEHGYLEGDDTDAHIDTLARFCSADTIAYVQCSDSNNPHYDALQKMEQELHAFRTKEGHPYNLLPLPMVPAQRDPDDGHLLPATYANFLIMNDAVLLPTYQCPETDTLAEAILQKAFPDREIIGIDCTALIKQHGSLHCVTMQYPKGTLQSQEEGSTS